MDVLGNVCNSDDPARLPLVRARVAPLISHSQRGPAVDLDALLLALVDDIMSGARTGCRNPYCRVKPGSGGSGCEHIDCKMCGALVRDRREI